MTEQMTDMYAQPDSPDPSDGAAGTSSSVATATMEKVADEAVDLRDHAASEVSAVVDTAKDQAWTLADEAKDRLKGEADNASERAAAALHDAADELKTMAAAVDDPGPAAKLVRSAGTHVDDVAARVRRDGYEGIARDVSRWARQNPGLFLVAAAGAGFALGRVFRSVDAKGVADAARGASSDVQDTQPAQGSGAVTASLPAATSPSSEDTVAGIGSMSPAVDAAPAVAPQPHPDASAPLMDPYGVTDPGSSQPGLSPEVPGGRP